MERLTPALSTTLTNTGDSKLVVVTAYFNKTGENQ